MEDDFAPHGRGSANRPCLSSLCRRHESPDLLSLLAFPEMQPIVAAAIFISSLLVGYQAIGLITLIFAIGM
jgi:hypothetical protein